MNLIGDFSIYNEQGYFNLNGHAVLPLGYVNPDPRSLLNLSEAELLKFRDAYDAWKVNNSWSNSYFNPFSAWNYAYNFVSHYYKSVTLVTEYLKRMKDKELDLSNGTHQMLLAIALNYTRKSIVTDKLSDEEKEFALRVISDYQNINNRKVDKKDTVLKTSQLALMFFKSKLRAVLEILKGKREKIDNGLLNKFFKNTMTIEQKIRLLGNNLSNEPTRKLLKEILDEKLNSSQTVQLIEAIPDVKAMLETSEAAKGLLEDLKKSVEKEADQSQERQQGSGESLILLAQMISQYFQLENQLDVDKELLKAKRTLLYDMIADDFNELKINIDIDQFKGHTISQINVSLEDLAKKSGSKLLNRDDYIRKYKQTKTEIQSQLRFYNSKLKSALRYDEDNGKEALKSKEMCQKRLRRAEKKTQKYGRWLHSVNLLSSALQLVNANPMGFIAGKLGADVIGTGIHRAYENTKKAQRKIMERYESIFAQHQEIQGTLHHFENQIESRIDLLEEKESVLFNYARANPYLFKPDDYRLTLQDSIETAKRRKDTLEDKCRQVEQAMAKLGSIDLPKCDKILKEIKDIENKRDNAILKVHEKLDRKIKGMNGSREAQKETAKAEEKIKKINALAEYELTRCRNHTAFQEWQVAQINQSSQKLQLETQLKEYRDEMRELNDGIAQDVEALRVAEILRPLREYVGNKFEQVQGSGKKVCADDRRVLEESKLCRAEIIQALENHSFPFKNFFSAYSNFTHELAQYIYKYDPDNKLRIVNTARVMSSGFEIFRSWQAWKTTLEVFRTAAEARFNNDYVSLLKQMPWGDILDIFINPGLHSLTAAVRLTTDLAGWREGRKEFNPVIRQLSEMRKELAGSLRALHESQADKRFEKEIITSVQRIEKQLDYLDKQVRGKLSKLQKTVNSNFFVSQVAGIQSKRQDIERNICLLSVREDRDALFCDLIDLELSQACESNLNGSKGAKVADDKTVCEKPYHYPVVFCPNEKLAKKLPNAYLYTAIVKQFLKWKFDDSSYKRKCQTIEQLHRCGKNLLKLSESFNILFEDLKEAQKKFVRPIFDNFAEAESEALRNEDAVLRECYSKYLASMVSKRKPSIIDVIDKIQHQVLPNHLSIDQYEENLAVSSSVISGLFGICAAIGLSKPNFSAGNIVAAASGFVCSAAAAKLLIAASRYVVDADNKDRRTVSTFENVVSNPLQTILNDARTVISSGKGHYPLRVYYHYSVNEERIVEGKFKKSLIDSSTILEFAIAAINDHAFADTTSESLLNMKEIKALPILKTGNTDYPTACKSIIDWYEDLLKRRFSKDCPVVPQPEKFLNQYCMVAPDKEGMRPLAFPVEFMKKIKTQVCFEEFFAKGFKSGRCRTTYDFVKRGESYELILKYIYADASTNKPREFKEIVISSVDADTVNAFRKLSDNPGAKVDKEPDINEFLLHYLYAGYFEGLGMPSKDSLKLDSGLIAPDVQPWPGLYKILEAFPDCKVNFNSKVYGPEPGEIQLEELVEEYFGNEKIGEGTPLKDYFYVKGILEEGERDYFKRSEGYKPFKKAYLNFIAYCRFVSDLSVEEIKNAVETDLKIFDPQSKKLFDMTFVMENGPENQSKFTHFLGDNIHPLLETIHCYVNELETCKFQGHKFNNVLEYDVTTLNL